MQLRVVDPDDDELPPGRGRRDLRARPAGDERLLEPARGDRAPLPQRLAPHQRPRSPRGRRLAHVHRAGDAHDQVGGREHLPGRGRGLPEAAPGGRRRGRDRGARPDVDAVGEGDRRAARRRGRDRRRAHRALPRSHRVVQEAEARRVRRPRSPAPGSRSTTTRSTRSSAAAGIRARRRECTHERSSLPSPTSTSTPTRTGAASACARVEPGVVVSELEDDFHHFVVDAAPRRRERCSRARTRRTGGRGRRAPTRPSPLRQLAGMPLLAPLHRGRAVDRSEAELHAPVRHRVPRDHARGVGPRRRASTTSRSRSATPSTGETDVRLWVDGELRLAWAHQLGRASIDPQPPFDDAPWRGGFMRWADATLPEDDAECAIVLRRACDIGMGRGMDLDAVPVADQLPAIDGRDLPHDAAGRGGRRVPQRRHRSAISPRPGSAAERLSA